MTARPTTQTSRKTVFSAWFLVGLCLLLLPNSLTLHCQTLFRHAFQVPLQFGSRIPALSAPKQVPQVAEPNLQYVQELEEKTKAQSNHIENLERMYADLKADYERLTSVRRNPDLNHLGLEAADVVMAPRPDYLILNFRIQDPDALNKGLYAIVDNAVVGRIVKANPFDSELQLVTHPESVIRAYIADSQAKSQAAKQIFGRLEGTAEGTMRMVVNSQDRIRIGAPVHAQRQPYLPIPFVIGRVSGCDYHKESPVLWEVLVEPATPLHNLRLVDIFRPKE